MNSSLCVKHKILLRYSVSIFGGAYMRQRQCRRIACMVGPQEHKLQWNFNLNSTHFFEEKAYAGLSQWETALHYNDVSHWLGANLELALHRHISTNWGHLIQSSVRTLISSMASGRIWTERDVRLPMLVRVAWDDTRDPCKLIKQRLYVPYWRLSQKTTPCVLTACLMYIRCQPYTC